MVVPSRAYGKGVKYQLRAGEKRVIPGIWPLRLQPVNNPARSPDMLGARRTACHIPTGQTDQSKAVMMREIPASEAKTRLPQLLDNVERGETLIITRHGKPIARLVPDEDALRERRAKAIEEIMALRKHTGRTTMEEFLAWRHEGPKY